jgi:2,5-furandicarboxylate decarboxylase 1
LAGKKASSYDTSPSNLHCVAVSVAKHLKVSDLLKGSYQFYFAIKGENMAKDMRDWIELLEEKDELTRLDDEINPRGNMSAFLDRSKEKALFFNNLTGHPMWRALGQAPANMRHVGLAFGTNAKGAITEFVRRMDQGLVPCTLVKNGPVKDVISKGKDVRITTLPAHIQGKRDGGPYITSGLVITKDPDTGVRNMAFHRLQIKGENKTGIMMVAGRHTHLIYQKYEAMDKAMPVAIMIGHHPMYYFSACYTGPLELDELELTGALLGEPVELVKCEEVDLEAPAHAEIILEGEIPPKIREDEGPFSEFQGYYFGGSGKNPIVELKAMTKRADAIYKANQNGPAVEGCLYHRVPMSAALFRDLRNVGGRVDLKDVYAHWGTIFGVVVQLIPRFYGEAKNVLLAALSSTYLHQKFAVAVDDDVDIYDPTDVAWAITTRVDPVKDIMIIPGLRGHALDESVTEKLREPQVNVRQELVSKVIIDATKPPISDPSRRALYERIKPLGS